MPLVCVAFGCRKKGSYSPLGRKFLPSGRYYKQVAFCKTEKNHIHLVMPKNYISRKHLVVRVSSHFLQDPHFLPSHPIKTSWNLKSARALWGRLTAISKNTLSRKDFMKRLPPEVMWSMNCLDDGCDWLRHLSNVWLRRLPHIWLHRLPGYRPRCLPRLIPLLWKCVCLGRLW